MQYIALYDCPCEVMREGDAYLFCEQILERGREDSNTGVVMAVSESLPFYDGNFDASILLLGEPVEPKRTRGTRWSSTNDHNFKRAAHFRFISSEGSSLFQEPFFVFKIHSPVLGTTAIEILFIS
jgi:hypothetical protein